MFPPMLSNRWRFSSRCQVSCLYWTWERMPLFDTELWPHWLPAGTLWHRNASGEGRWLQAARSAVPFLIHSLKQNLFYFAARFNMWKLNNFVWISLLSPLSAVWNSAASQTKVGWAKAWPTAPPGMRTWCQTAVCCTRFSQHTSVLWKVKFCRRSSADIIQNLFFCFLNNNRHLFIGTGLGVCVGEYTGVPRTIMRWLCLCTKLNDSLWDNACCDSHRITECSGLEGTSVGHPVQPPWQSRVT